MHHTPHKKHPQNTTHPETMQNPKRKTWPEKAIFCEFTASSGQKSKSDFFQDFIFRGIYKGVGG